jgi:hypothetical protein
MEDDILSKRNLKANRNRDIQKADFKPEKRQGHYILINGTIQQKDRTIGKIHVLSIHVLNLLNQILLDKRDK